MLAELILGGIVVFLTIKGIQALEKFVMRSKSPLVNGTVNVLGVLAAASLAKSALRDVTGRPRDRR